jgi:hypothetical protein
VSVFIAFVCGYVSGVSLGDSVSCGAIVINGLMYIDGVSAGLGVSTADIVFGLVVVIIGESLTVLLSYGLAVGGKMFGGNM